MVKNYFCNFLARAGCAQFTSFAIIHSLGFIGRKLHYAPLMMSQKESPRNRPWVLPKRVASLVWVPDSRLIFCNGWFLLLFTRQGKHYWLGGENNGWLLGDSFYYSLGRAEILLIGRRKWWVIPGWFLLLFLPCPNLPCSRNHSLSGNSNHFVYCSWKHPGSTHGWFLGDSFCDIMNGA